jgi:hypothetical protein
MPRPSTAGSCVVSWNGSPPILVIRSHNGAVFCVDIPPESAEIVGGYRWIISSRDGVISDKSHISLLKTIRTAVLSSGNGRKVVVNGRWSAVIRINKRYINIIPPELSMRRGVFYVGDARLDAHIAGILGLNYAGRVPKWCLDFTIEDDVFVHAPVVKNHYDGDLLTVTQPYGGYEFKYCYPHVEKVDGKIVGKFKIPDVDAWDYDSVWHVRLKDGALINDDGENAKYYVRDGNVPDETQNRRCYTKWYRHALDTNNYDLRVRLEQKNAVMRKGATIRTFAVVKDQWTEGGVYVV